MLAIDEDLIEIQASDAWRAPLREVVVGIRSRAIGRLFKLYRGPGDWALFLFGPKSRVGRPPVFGQYLESLLTRRAFARTDGSASSVAVPTPHRVRPGRRPFGASIKCPEGRLEPSSNTRGTSVCARSLCGHLSGLSFLVDLIPVLLGGLQRVDHPVHQCGTIDELPERRRVDAVAIRLRESVGPARAARPADRDGPRGRPRLQRDLRARSLSTAACDVTYGSTARREAGSDRSPVKNGVSRRTWRRAPV